MIRAFNCETNKELKSYRTMLEVAEDFDLTLEAVKSYFQRYKLKGDTRIKNHRTNTWCYLERPETKKIPNYKDRCEKAIEYIKKNSYGWEIKYFQDEALASELLEILGEKK